MSPSWNRVSREWNRDAMESRVPSSSSRGAKMRMGKRMDKVINGVLVACHGSVASVVCWRESAVRSMSLAY
eukprot:scaffold248417_cov67-Attheya_sp.AAC.3